MGEIPDQQQVLHSLLYSAPEPRLSKSVSLLFAWTGLAQGYDGWMPAIDAQLVIRLSGTAWLERLDGRIVELPSKALIGPLSGTVRLVASPGYCAIGAGLTPTGLRGLFDILPGDLTDSAIDLEALCSTSDLARLLDRVGDLGRPQHAWRIVEAFLLDRLRHDHGFIDWRIRAVDCWMRSSLNPSVDDLSAVLGLSARQAARVTNLTHGLSPKLLAMRWRTQSAAEHFAVVDPDALSLASFGFSDESHMIRNFRRFIGTTPRRFIDRDEMVRHTFAGPKIVGASLI